MGRQSKKLSALEVNRLNEPGKYPLGESLYLQVSKTGSKSYLFRYSQSGKSTWMGLGSTKILPLAEARLKVNDFQRDILNGQDPLTKKNEAVKEQKLQESRKITFDECAQKYIESHSKSWKNEKHTSQWANTLQTYASPSIGHLPVQDIDLQLIIKILQPIWLNKTETASRLRGRIERILNWAAINGYRSTENPARWRGHLDAILPKKSAVMQVKHFNALPIKDLPEFMQKLRAQQSVASLALEFVILTATRTNETLGAKWSEINFEENYWLIPASRMKAKKEHKIPLGSRAIELLKKVKQFSSSEYIFPGAKIGCPLSNTALLMILRRMGLKVTTHGFRSTFSDWSAERTKFPREVVEMALAHAVKSKVEAAYRRGDLFLKRQVLMNAWAEYCSKVSVDGSVVGIYSKNG